MRPFIVEFLGVPESGKTTSIKLIKDLLENEGLKVSVVRESAEMISANIPKGSWESNLWMRLNTLAMILEASYTNTNDLILVDRGNVDASFWGKLYYNEGKCSELRYSVLKKMGCLSERFNSDFVIVLTVDVEEAIRRRGGEGRIVTRKWLEKFKAQLEEFCDEIKGKIIINTTRSCQTELVDKLKKIILDEYNKYCKNQ